MPQSELTITFVELCQTCDVEQQILIDMVEFGLFDPEPPHIDHPDDWTFQVTVVERAQKALRLHYDLSVNFAGIALVLDLLEEIDQLRSQAAQIKSD